MAAGDPTYPFYPIVCLLSAGMLLLVLLTSFIRQSWNLGVAFLCFWLFFENLTEGVNAIIWADNADIKLYVYCDIVSRLQILTSIVKPMATLIITRRLYLIASLQSAMLPDKTARYRDMGIEWTLGLVIPVIVTGPLYYIVQVERFLVQGGFGCTNALDDSILRILLVSSWSVIPPLVSIVVYYPRMARILYRRRHDLDNFLQSNNSDVSQTHYIRILALASIDILLTLPIGIVSVVLAVTQSLSFNGLPFYSGWTFVHTDWEPESMPYSVLVTFGTSNIAKLYFNRWASPVLAFVVFGLFGVTLDARASYWRTVRTVCGVFGWKWTPRTHRERSLLDTMEFGERPQDVALDAEIGSTQPSFVSSDMRAQAQHTHLSYEREKSGSNLDSEEEAWRVRGNTGIDGERLGPT